MFLAVDTDIFLYRCTSAAEREVQWDDDVWSLWADLTEAKEMFHQQMKDIGEKLGVDNMVCALSDSTNYRKTVDPNYKSNRRDHASRLATPP